LKTADNQKSFKNRMYYVLKGLMPTASCIKTTTKQNRS
jgi:hypothetical protein